MTVAVALAAFGLVPAAALAQDGDDDGDHADDGRGGDDDDGDGDGGSHGGGDHRPDQREHDGVVIDAHVALTWHSATGIGFRVDVPIVPDGLVDGVDDDLRISPGLDLLWFFYPGHSGFGAYPILPLQWNFYLDPEWSVGGEVGMTFLFAPDRDRYWRYFAGPYLGALARWHFAQRNALLLRLSWPGGLDIGITF